MAKFAAKGTKFKRGDGGSPEAFTAVGNLRTIGDFEITADQIDVTDHDSGQYKEFLNAFLDGGEVPLSGFFNPEDQQQLNLLTDLKAQSTRNWRIVFPDPSVTNLRFAGMVVRWKVGAPYEGAVPFESTIKVSGEPTLHSGE